MSPPIKIDLSDPNALSPEDKQRLSILMQKEFSEGCNKIRRNLTHDGAQKLPPYRILNNGVIEEINITNSIFKVLDSQADDYIVPLEFLNEGNYSRIKRCYSLCKIKGQCEIALKIFKPTPNIEQVINLEQEISDRFHATNYAAFLGRAGKGYTVLPYFGRLNLATVISCPEFQQSDYLMRTKLVLALLAELQRFHDMEKLHGDLNPNNFMVLNYEKNSVAVKLVDFGLSQNLRVPNALGIFGTPGFVAPELYREIQYKLQPRLDIYSLGLTIAEVYAHQDFHYQQVEARVKELKEAKSQSRQADIAQRPYDLDSISDDNIQDMVRQMTSCFEYARPILTVIINFFRKMLWWYVVDFASNTANKNEAGALKREIMLVENAEEARKLVLKELTTLKIFRGYDVEEGSLHTDILKMAKTYGLLNELCERNVDEFNLDQEEQRIKLLESLKPQYNLGMK
jgi:serine/threonine protein kinase